MWAAVRELGLEGRRVTCVARGLKALAGFGAPRFAVIDVGTNSVKFHLGEREANGRFRRIHDRAEVTRLGEGLERTGRLARVGGTHHRRDRGHGRGGRSPRGPGDRRGRHRRTSDRTQRDEL